jgi:hypothetical protein
MGNQGATSIDDMVTGALLLSLLYALLGSRLNILRFHLPLISLINCWNIGL